MGLLGGGNSSTQNTDASVNDNRNQGAQNDLFANEEDGVINITDSGIVSSALNFANNSVDSVAGGFGELIDGFISVVNLQDSTFNDALGFSGKALEESANIVGTVKSGESFSTVTNSKNIMVAGGLLAAAIIAAMVLKK